MSRSILAIHILQTVPPSNMNRDDTGSPKTATYGGVKRARVSSQAWKRAVRADFRQSLLASDVGVRTKRVVDALADILADRGTSVEQAAATAHDLLAAAGLKLSEPKKGDKEGRRDRGAETGFLFFVSPRQLEALAELAGEDMKDRKVKESAKEALRTGNSIDIALFGRMVAEPDGLGVDAACQVAHAISVHRADTEYDYFTAVDDRKAASEDEDAGAGMIGTIEFNSATLYRYAAVDLDLLADNLDGGQDAAEAAVAFLKAFVTSMPEGKQTTFGNSTLPDLVVVELHEEHPTNLSGAFEEPVVSRGGGFAAPAAERLAAHRLRIQTAYGITPAAAWTFGTIDPGAGLPAAVPMPSALEAIGELLAQRMAGR